MTEPTRAVQGDFHVIRMDGLFHVVFRPDADPEWFRIIASFYTYERAYSYCDIERVSVWSWPREDGTEAHDSETGEEEAAGLRAPPVEPIPEGWMATRDGCAEMVRNVMEDADANVQPHPEEDFSDQPKHDEAPKDYNARVQEDAITAICQAADELPPEPEPELPPSPKIVALNDLTDNQWSVLQFFQGRAEIGGTVTASMEDIASEAGVARGSTPYFLEVLERKGFIDVVERGGATATGVYRLNDPATREDKGPKCRTCGGSCSLGSRQCKACYRGELKIVSA